MDTELGRKICVIAFALALLPACDDSKSKGVVYTLYRNSPAFADMRIHVATFDAAEDKDYNRDNCEIARDLFASQPGVTIKYWLRTREVQRMMVQPMWRATQFKRLFGLGLMRWRRAEADALAFFAE